MLQRLNILGLNFKLETAKPFGFYITIIRDKPENIFMIFHFGLGITYHYDTTELPTPKMYYVTLDFFRKIKEGERIKYAKTFRA